MNIWDGFRILASSMSEREDAWEWSIRQFEEQDRGHRPPEGAVVFTGSSSITQWDSLERDMAPLPVINRRFGGSRIHRPVKSSRRRDI